MQLLSPVKLVPEPRGADGADSASLLVADGLFLDELAAKVCFDLPEEAEVDEQSLSVKFRREPLQA